MSAPDHKPPPPPQALEGVKVVELGTLIAGPYTATMLAQFGAEVIKIEPPGQGDPLRYWRMLHKDTSLWWYSHSRNKKSVTVNLKEAEGQQIVRQLVSEADIVIENFRPGALESWGLGWEHLSQVNPKLIMVRVSGYGQTGPYRDRPGYAAIAESLGGLRYITGYPDRPPVRTGVSIGDTLASLYGTIGALLAMHHLKVNNGTGQFIDVALYEAVFGVMESLIPEYSGFGFVRERSGASLPGISPSNTYACRDGRHIIIAGNGDSIFRRLMIAIDRTDLANDPELARNDGRVRHNQRIDDAISAWTGQHDLERALEILAEAEVPCDRIYDVSEIAADPHVQARGMLEEHRLEDGKRFAIPAAVPRLSATPGHTHSLGPQLGQDTDAVLKGLGMNAEQLAELRRRKII